MTRIRHIDSANPPGIVDRVRLAAAKLVLFTPHVTKQMSRLDRVISAEEVRSVVTQGVLIEDYPEDPRGHSCLLLGYGDGGRALHVCCAPKSDYLAIITAYLPDPRQWSKGFTRRRRK